MERYSVVHRAVKPVVVYARPAVWRPWAVSEPEWFSSLPGWAPWPQPSLSNPLLVGLASAVLQVDFFEPSRPRRPEHLAGLPFLRFEVGTQEQR